MFDIQGNGYRSGIYQIYNKITNKRYIGSSISIRRRWSQHLHALKHNIHHSKHLQNAWNKYGEDAFVFQCLEFCEPENLLSLEHDYITYYKTTNREYGYNTTEDVENALKMQDKDRIKISKALLGRKWTEEQRQKFIKSRTGKKQPKISETRKRQIKDGTVKLVKINEVSEEKQKIWKQHISESKKKYYENNPNHVYHPIKIESEDFVMYFPTVKKAAEYLNVCVDTIRNVAKTGKCRKYIPYRVYYVSVDEYNQNKNV